jgi:hypothetical protein
MKCIISLYSYHSLFNIGLRTSQEPSVSSTVEPLAQHNAPKDDIQTLDDGDPVSSSEQASDPSNWGIPAEWRLPISFAADVYLCKNVSPKRRTPYSRCKLQRTYSGRF